MRTAIIAGATGLIGHELVQMLIKSDKYRIIYVISRRKGIVVHEKIRETVIDFDSINNLRFDEPIDDVFCTLGTTMKQAGSRDKFKKVDFEYVVSLATLSKLAGASNFLVVSSMGANPNSPVFYNRIKGLTEEALKQLGFKNLVILRPSLLLGERPEKRFAERLSGFFMKSLSFLIPDNYKAIQAQKVAKSMLKLAIESSTGISIVQSAEMLRN